jgi:hypothetical protein
MKFAGHKPIGTYWTYYMDGAALSHEFSGDQFQIGERNLTAVNPKNHTPIAIGQSISTVNHPQVSVICLWSSEITIILATPLFY